MNRVHDFTLTADGPVTVIAKAVSDKARQYIKDHPGYRSYGDFIVMGRQHLPSFHTDLLAHGLYMRGLGAELFA